MKDSHLDVWLIDLAHDMPPFEVACTYLDAVEDARCRRFHFQKHQKRFAYTRLAVKTILARYVSEAPQHLCFNYHAHGKPYLDAANQLQFNFSHTRDQAILVVGRTEPVGVDLESISMRAFSGIASHVFTDAEQAYLQTLPPSLLPLGFFSIWTLKEAVIKAIGMGLRYPVQILDVGFRGPPPMAMPIAQQGEPLENSALASGRQVPTSIGTIYEPLFQKQWQLYTFLTRPGCVGAICCHPHIQTLDYHVYHPATS